MKLKILAFDTSTDWCSVALSYGDEIIVMENNATKRHNELILPMIDEVLRKAQLKLAQLDAIAFGCGPGSFTGIRLATSIAQGLAFGANLPLIPVSTLRILAQTAHDKFAVSQAIVLLDAHMNQVYCGVYRAENDLMVNVVDDFVSTPTNLALPEQCKNWPGLGNGWSIYADKLRQLSARDTLKEELYPDGRSLIALAIDAYRRGQTLSPLMISPAYLSGNELYHRL